MLLYKDMTYLIKAFMFLDDVQRFASRVICYCRLVRVRVVGDTTETVWD